MITWNVDLWERGINIYLVGDTEAYGAAREDRPPGGNRRMKVKPYPFTARLCQRI